MCLLQQIMLLLSIYPFSFLVMMVNYDVRDYANLIDHTGLFIPQPTPPPPPLKFANKRRVGEKEERIYPRPHESTRFNYGTS